MPGKPSKENSSPNSCDKTYQGETSLVLFNGLTGNDPESIKKSYLQHLTYSLARNAETATPHNRYASLALSVRDRLTERWVVTQKTYYEQDPKRVYYLSMEFLIGRTLGNAMINLGLEDSVEKAMTELGNNLEVLEDMEPNAGLGNGGLGRLAACFLDSMATLELPAYGYGIRYEYGIFHQRIQDGYQLETPDNWLRNGNPWEIERSERLYPVKFYGHVHQYHNDKGMLVTDWVDTEHVMAMAYDVPVPGYHNNTVNNLRLWAAKSTREFDFHYFNDGDYEKAVSEKASSETISKVLYPNDSRAQGKELRLRQEYFFVSASIQDIIDRYLKTHKDFHCFPEKVAIQLNDTHPAIAVAELMHQLIDVAHLPWDRAWDITVKTFAYTNHTVMPEALERWSVELLEKVLPRHLQIIYEINERFLQMIKLRYPNDMDRLRRMSLIEETNPKHVRMAFLAIVGSHSVNGVSELHTNILKADQTLFKDFYELWPEKFNAKTNGITQRRWLKLCNPGQSRLITEKIGDGWITDLYQLKRIAPFAEDSKFQKEWREVKRQNKERLAKYIKAHHHIEVNLDSIFDCQVKRIHEYKRQMLNVLHVIWMYNWIKQNPKADFVPRTVLFAGKAAPGYFMAKLIIKLINSVGSFINHDPGIDNKLKVIFLENYSVSQAEIIMPASDLSQQISTAGTEASGTGNMKFALNGALTIGTLDGANIEIMEEVGAENMFLFGLKTNEVHDLKHSGYNPMSYYESDPELKAAIDLIRYGYLAPSQPGLFDPIVQSLLYDDRYMLLADFRDYIRSQREVEQSYSNQKKWTRMSILNVANMGRFSSDRTIQQYTDEIWNAKPVTIGLPTKEASPKKRQNRV
ncbi:MAG: glycogen/starch/alpha-glucan phosphorylase [Chlorobiales bacterium]|nr:glycogen/starch/alpha-glucan phosphorylase [Chlorobiales bacterium]